MHTQLLSGLKKDNGNSWICIYHFLLSGPFHPHMGMFYFLANGPNASAQQFLNNYITNVRLLCLFTEGQTGLAESIFHLSIIT